MTKDEIFDVLRKDVLFVLPELEPSQITRDASLRDLGANSIDRADIITDTMRTLDLRIRLGELAGLKNIGELVDFLHQQHTGTNSRIV